MRELVSARGPINARSDAFGAEAMALMGVIASLQQTSVAPAVKRAADGLASGFIAPAAGGRSGDLAERQTAVVGKVERRSPRRPRRCRTPPTRSSPRPRGRARALPAAVHRRSGAALCRRLHPELGRRDLDRPDAGGAGADLLRGACHHPPRRACRKRAPRTMSAADMITALRLAREVETRECGGMPRAAVRDSRSPPPPSRPTRTSRRLPTRARQEGLIAVLASAGAVAS